MELDPNEVIAMALTCSRCGTMVTNDLPRSQVPDQLAFLAELRSLGWRATHHQAAASPAPNPATPDGSRLCPKCASS